MIRAIILVLLAVVVCVCVSGHDFFKPYAVTFDFENMKIFLQ